MSTEDVTRDDVGEATRLTLEEAPRVVAPRGPMRRWWSKHTTVAYVIRRFGIYVITLWAAITVTFFFFRLIPGDPIGAYIENLQQNYAYNQKAGEAVIDHYKEIFGLNGSLLSQYGHYMYQLVFHQNFGPSLVSYPDPAQDVIGRALPWTVGLLLIATIIGWFIGVVAGALVGVATGQQGRPKRRPTSQWRRRTSRSISSGCCCCSSCLCAGGSSRPDMPTSRTCNRASTGRSSPA